MTPTNNPNATRAAGGRPGRGLGGTGRERRTSPPMPGGGVLGSPGGRLLRSVQVSHLRCAFIAVGSHSFIFSHTHITKCFEA